MTEILLVFGVLALALYGFSCLLKNSFKAVLKFAKEIKNHKNSIGEEVTHNGSDYC